MNKDGRRRERSSVPERVIDEEEEEETVEEESRAVMIPNVFPSKIWFLQNFYFVNICFGFRPFWEWSYHYIRTKRFRDTLGPAPTLLTIGPSRFLLTKTILGSLKSQPFFSRVKTTELVMKYVLFLFSPHKFLCSSFYFYYCMFWDW